jgi:serine/threonine protein phosphatase 1
MARLLAVGDINGYRNKLSRLLDLVQPSHDDRLVFIGDYVDRGPDVPGTIKLLLDLQREFPGTVFLTGNHYHLLLSMLSARGHLA